MSLTIEYQPRENPWLSCVVKRRIKIKIRKEITAMKKVIFPNGLYFVEGRKEIVNTLFLSGNTASGHYRKGRGGITFYNLQGEPFLFLAASKRGVFLFVSCDQRKDSMWYLNSTCSLDEKYLGLDKLTYLGKRELAKEIYNLIIETA
jgi:hypothetical protein